jgi:predicted RNA binding protein YcfA (HicA-like mRNA interferase family)
MPDELPALRPIVVVAALRRAGFAQVRQTGAHITLRHPLSRRTVIVARHNKDLKKGTLHGIIASSGLSREEFLRLLR